MLVLPFLTKLRTQCAFFCPFGAFQSLSNKISVFEIRMDRTKCADCVTCRRACPTLVLDETSVAKGRAGMSCMKCGACVDACTKDAVRWHIKGTSLTASSGDGAAALPVPRLGLRHPVRRQHHRQHAGEDLRDVRLKEGACSG